MQANSGGGDSLTFTNPVTSGSLLVASFSTQGSIASIGISDTLGTTWTRTTNISGESNNMAVYYGQATKSGPNTVTISSGPNNADRLAIMEIPNASPTVLQTSSIYSAVTPTTLSISVSQEAILVLCAGASSNSAQITYNAPFFMASSSNGSNANAIGYQPVNAGSYNAVINVAGGGNNQPIIMVAFPYAPPSQLSASKANVYAVLEKPNGFNASKTNVYAVLEKSNGLNASKANIYAVLEKPNGLNVSKALVYAVLIPPNSNPPIWPNMSFPNGMTGINYSQTFEITDVGLPVTYSIISGSLPPGLQISPIQNSTAILNGIPSQIGTYAFTIQAANSYGSSSQTFSIQIFNSTVIVNTEGGNFGWIG